MIKSLRILITIFLLTLSVACGDVFESNQGTTIFGNSHIPSGSITIGALEDGTFTVTIPLTLFGESEEALQDVGIDVDVDGESIEENLEPSPYYYTELEAVVFLLAPDGAHSIDDWETHNQDSGFAANSTVEITLYRNDETSSNFEGTLSDEGSTAWKKRGRIMAAIYSGNQKTGEEEEHEYFDTDDLTYVNSHGLSHSALVIPPSNDANEIKRRDTDTYCRLLIGCFQGK